MEQFVDDEMIIYHDPYASSILTSSVRFFIGSCRFSWFRNWIISTSEKTMLGAYAEILCRKLFIDQKLQKSMEKVGVAVETGTGNDSRSLCFLLLS